MRVTAAEARQGAQCHVTCNGGSLPTLGPGRPVLTGSPAERLSSLPDDKSELEGSTLSVLSAASTASRLLPPQERLREKAFEYCQRLIEQSNRRESRCPSTGAASAAPGRLLFSDIKPRELGLGQHPSWAPLGCIPGPAGIRLQLPWEGRLFACPVLSLCSWWWGLSSSFQNTVCLLIGL